MEDSFSFMFSELKKMKNNGKFVISLDFELLWGVRDKRTIESYGENLANVWEVLPKMLELFEKYNVSATFATVGFLFAKDKKELLKYVPTEKPLYENANLSPYNGHLESLKNEQTDSYHFAESLIQLLQKYPKQEIASHTFSHYYCLEKGQTLADFERDLAAAMAIAKAKNISLESLVFPRNQFNEKYLKVCAEQGICGYRGNEKVWFHEAASQGSEKWYKRAFRLLDAYLNIGGHYTYSIEEIAKIYPYNMPSSRFLRPFTSKMKLAEPLKFRRIQKSMTYAAKNKEVYHLWWHPHNFGKYQNENFAFLEKILKHYQKLHKTYQFESMSMKTIADKLKNNNL